MPLYGQFHLIAVDEEEVQRVMHALSHPIRRRILRTLDTRYGLDMYGLRAAIMKRERTFITRQGVHKHLMVLRKAKLVIGGGGSEGGERGYYYMDPLPIRRTFRDLGRLLKRHKPGRSYPYFEAVTWRDPDEEISEEDRKFEAEIEEFEATTVENLGAAAELDEKAKDEAFMRMLNESEFE